ncbi:MAG TPA: hypothetical protein VF177_02370 [Anaerolineae bacterium]
MPQPVFDPNKIAYYEKAGWEAYYDRNWPRAFWLLVKLNRTQFRMSRWTAVTAALDTVRASLAFAPIDNDVPEARRHIEKFFEKARRSLNIKASASTLAEREIDYWLIHRELALQRQQAPHEDNLEPLVQSLANLHAALFDSTPAAMRRSAERRALAMKAVDRITGNYSTDVAADWQETEEYLRQAYRAVEAARSQVEGVTRPEWNKHGQEKHGRE